MRFVWIVAVITSVGMAADPVRIEDRHIERKLPGCGDERDGCEHLELTYVEVGALGHAFAVGKET
jgi:hypothetical protein